jgi:hypothetical protein
LFVGGVLFSFVEIIKARPPELRNPDVIGIPPSVREETRLASCYPKEITNLVRLPRGADKPSKNSAAATVSIFLQA